MRRARTETDLLLDLTQETPRDPVWTTSLERWQMMTILQHRLCGPSFETFHEDRPYGRVRVQRRLLVDPVRESKGGYEIWTVTSVGGPYPQTWYEWDRFLGLPDFE